MPPVFVCLVVLLACLPARAAVYDLAIAGDALGRSLRLNIPDTVPVVRGIIIWGNGASGDSRGRATTAELVALAEEYGFAVIGTAYWGDFWSNGPYEVSLLENALSQLAVQSGHSELTVVPWMPIGHSNGGLMSYGMNNLRPAKVLGVILSKAGAYTVARPEAAVLQTPGLLLAGELDDIIRIDGIRDRFFGNRPRGALWSWVEEQGMDHSEGNSPELLRPFAEMAIKLRYPVSAPAGSQVQLNSLVEQDGWLTDPDSYKTGLADIAPYASYTKNRSVAGWLPNRRIAYIFRAFASYDKASPTATLTLGLGPVDWGTTLTYTLGAPSKEWRFIEYYEGDVLLKTVTPSSPDALTVSAPARVPGYAVFHALVTFTDGTQRTTMPRRTFVKAGTPRAPSILQPPSDQAVQLAKEAIFNVVASSPVRPAYRWQRSSDNGLSWVTLADGAGFGGTTSDTLLVHAVSLAMSGWQFRCAVSNGMGADAVSAGAKLSFLSQPQILLSPVSATAGIGARVVFSVLASDSRPLSYLWMKNGSVIPGAVDAKLVIENVKATDAGSYSVVVSNSEVSAVGSAVTLTVDPAPFVAQKSALTGISTRGQVGTGDNIMIAGFVVGGNGAKTLLIRASGPALSAATQGRLPGVLADPKLELTKIDGTLLASNDDWSGDPAISAAVASIGIGSFASGSKDSALVVTLPPGVYTALVRGVGNSTGIALVEVYDLDQAAASRLLGLSTRAFVGTNDQVLIAGISVSGSSPLKVLVRALGPTLGQVTSGQIANVLPDPNLALIRLDGVLLSANDNWTEPSGTALADAAIQIGINPLIAASRDAALLASLPAGLYTPTVTERSGINGIALVEVYEAK